MFYVSKISLEL